jgi:hypothetical protein
MNKVGFIIINRYKYELFIISSMIIVALGIFHLIHCPILIVYPFLFYSYTSDVLYITYFFFIMFLYTFINGECPISYLSKLIINRNYIAGDNITYYPEMKYIAINNNYTDCYFAITTTFYILTLWFVITRTIIPIYFLIPSFFVLCVYFLFIRNNILKKTKYFSLMQKITKYILILTIFILLSFLSFVV